MAAVVRVPSSCQDIEHQEVSFANKMDPRFVIKYDISLGIQLVCAQSLCFV